jgi:DNA-directed RNA polymerase subunit RPC12/RpoP
MRKTYDYKCTTCGRKSILLVEEDERNNQQPCGCGGMSDRTWSVPNVRTAKISATFVDGQRAKSKEWQEMRTQEALEDRVHEAGDFSERLEANIELNKFKESTTK